MFCKTSGTKFSSFEYILNYIRISVKIKNARNLDFSKFLAFILTGDEGIEPPPKVLETPIIPLDQSPLTQKKVFLCWNTFKTTHKLIYFLISFHLFSIPITFTLYSFLLSSAFAALVFAKYSAYGYALDRLVTVSYIHYCTSTSVLSTLSSSRGLTNLTLWDILSWGGLHA